MFMQQRNMRSNSATNIATCTAGQGNSQWEGARCGRFCAARSACKRREQSAQCFARQCVHVDRRTTAAGISRINISILRNITKAFHPFLLRLQGLPHKACCAYQKSCTRCCALLLVGGKIELFWIFICNSLSVAKN